VVLVVRHVLRGATFLTQELYRFRVAAVGLASLCGVNSRITLGENQKHTRSIANSISLLFRAPSAADGTAPFVVIEAGARATEGWLRAGLDGVSCTDTDVFACTGPLLVLFGLFSFFR